VPVLAKRGSHHGAEATPEPALQEVWERHFSANVPLQHGACKGDVGFAFQLFPHLKPPEGVIPVQQPPDERLKASPKLVARLLIAGLSGSQ
jgi:hypothetical protein